MLHNNLASDKMVTQTATIHSLFVKLILFKLKNYKKHVVDCYKFT